MRTYELVAVSGGPYPLLNKDRTCCLLRLVVLEQGQRVQYLVEVNLSDGELGDVCLPIELELGKLHEDPGGRAWLVMLDLGKHPAVDAARELARQGQPS